MRHELPDRRRQHIGRQTRTLKNLETITKQSLPTENGYNLPGKETFDTTFHDEKRRYKP